MKKWIVVLAAVVALTIPSSSAEAISGQYFTGAAHSLNNDIVGIDYKLTAEEQNAVIDALQYSYLSKEDLDESSKYINSSSDRDIDLGDYSHANGDVNKSTLNDQAVAKAWLLQGNYLERKGLLFRTGDSKVYKFVRCEDYAREWKQTFEKRADNVKGKFLNKDGEALLGKNEVLQTFNQYVDDAANNSILMQASSEEDADIESSVRIRRLEKFKRQLKSATAGASRQRACELGVEYVDLVCDYAASFQHDFTWLDEDDISKTEFLTLLCKTAFGIEKSRPIVFNAPAVRNGNTYSTSTQDYWNDGAEVSYLGGYWDTGQFKGAANFESGDFYYYVSSNVTELYLKTLLDRGVIYLDEFGDNKISKQFKKEYQNYTNELPAWASAQGVCSSGLENSLGAGYYFKSGGTELECRHPRFFSEESLSVMEVYQYVEDVLRLTEKDITQTEADIITYKYGLNYLASYSGKQLKTLQFLIAKGILNFENPSEFYNLDDTMTYSRLFQLLYRVACKDARYDFSQVQLTDSESHWIAKGYAENTLEMMENKSGFLMNHTTPEEIDEDEELLLAESFIDTVYADKSTWSVTYRLAKDLDWSYNGTTLASMLAGGTKPVTVLSIKEGNVSYAGTTESVYILELEITATSAEAAIKYAENKLVTTDAGKGVDTVVKVKSNGSAEDQEEYSMISQTTLRQKFSNISIIEDKVLVNTDTGCQAILFPDLGYAMVGNTIVRTDGFIEEKADTEIYYNLKIILSMLDDEFLKKAGIKPVIVGSKTTFHRYKANVETEYDSAYSKCWVSTIKATTKMVEDSEDYGLGDSMSYYKVNDLTDGVNTMARKFHVSGVGSVYLVVDWSFVIPTIDNLAMYPEMSEALGNVLTAVMKSNGSLEDAIDDGTKKDKGTLTNEDIAEAFYTRPNGSAVLEAWWDSNYVANNALVNFILGTKGVDYVTSGYLTPSISILTPKSLSESEQVVCANDLFRGIEFRSWKDANGNKKTGDKDVTDETLQGYFTGGNDGEAWWQFFFNQDSAFSGLEFNDTVTENGTTRELTDSEKTDRADAISVLVENYRKFNFYTGKQIKKYGGWDFGLTYFLTNSGILYRNIDSDWRVEAGVITKKAAEPIRSLRVTTRLPDTAEAQEETSVVTSTLSEGSPEMLYGGTTTIEVKGTSGTYYVFHPIEKVVKDKTTSKLYNGVFVGFDSETIGKSEVEPEWDLFLDRGETAKKRYAGTKAMYNAWANKFLGEDVGLKYKYVPTEQRFCFPKIAAKKAKVSKELMVNQAANVFTSSADKCTQTEALKAFWDNVPNYFNEYTDTSQGEKYQQYKTTGIAGGSGIGIQGASDSDYFLVLTHGSDAGKNAFSFINRVGYSDKVAKTSAAYPNRSCTVDNGRVDHSCVAFAVPTLYVPVSDYTIMENEDGSYVLEAGGAVAALCMSNLYYSGILKNIQETIIAEYVGTRQLNTLDAGDIVCLEGIRYYVDKGQDGNDWIGLTSAVLNVRKNSGKQKIVEAARNWKYTSVNAKGKVSNKKKAATQVMFRTKAAKLINSTFIKCDGFSYTLYSYLRTPNAWNGDSGIQIGGLKKTAATKKKGLIYKKGNTVYGYKKGTSRKITKDVTEDYQYARVQFYLNGDLTVRPLNAEQTKFTLTGTTVSGNIGSGNSAFFFFDEELSYDRNLYADLSTSTALFNPSAAFTAMKAKFERVYRKTLAKDIRTLILEAICAVSVYLSVMSWIAYLVLHYGVMHQLFTALDAGASGSGSSGLDLLSLFTFKMYTLNDDPPLYRIVIIQFVCACISAVCVILV